MNFLTPEQIDNGVPFYLTFDTVAEALPVARQLQQKGFLFRGQSNAKWLVTSSAERLTDVDRAEAEEKMARFVAWARQSPQLKDFSSDLDSLIAVGQHYGMATYFIDFTDDPEVAAFFACHSSQEPEPGQRAAIACFNPKSFTEFWRSGYGARLLTITPGAEPPEIIRIDVQNLWRLQAQRGCFLWNPIFGIERIFNFDRLTFPCTRNDPAVRAKEQIYPRNESALEQLLKSFFMNEQMREGNAWVKSAGFKIVRYDTGEKGYDMKSWYPSGVESTPDWAEAPKWELLPNERAEDALASPPLAITWSSAPNLIAGELLQQLTTDFISTNRGAGLFFTGGDEIDPVAARLQACVRRLWNGMRILPFSEREIREALEATFAAFLPARRTAHGTAVELADPMPGKFRQHVDFTRNREGTGDYSRGYVSDETLIQAHSPAFLHAAAEYLATDAPNPVELLRLRARPWQRFSFTGLRRLMVQELIPSQLVLRGDDPTENALKTMIYFSPADLKIFGLA